LGSSKGIGRKQLYRDFIWAYLAIFLRFDAVSAWFVLLTNFTSVTGILYGSQYLSIIKPAMLT
jgi:hypothetical protein